MKNILIFGGTGSLGTCLIKNLTEKSPGSSITVISRDEQKQQIAKRTFKNVNYFLGDIRDEKSIARHFKNKSSVFHFAALKHVDVIEDNPMESVKTNVLASETIANLCIENNVRSMVFSSTDKACEPINVYGQCKAISERIFMQKNEDQSKTNFSVYRWGNVLFSNGSALSYFNDCLNNNQEINITDPEMTRFWIHLDDAVSFMLWSMGSLGFEIKIPPQMKCSKVLRVIERMAMIKDVKFSTKVIGIRKGEKIHESILPGITSKNSPNYSDKELDDLLERFLGSTT